MNFPAKLLLEDETIFEGEGFGCETLGVGEVVFNTAMTGYQEIITDPSYDGQMITFTYPHIGNTGINSVDYESKKIFARGLIVRDFCTFPSNWRSEQSLDDYLKLNKTICISNIDTRFLTKKIRDEGCKVGVIYPSEKITDKEAMIQIKDFGSISDKNLIKNVATNSKFIIGEKKNKSQKRIAAVDFGVKENILRIFKDMGAVIEVFPPDCTAEEVLNSKPDGIFFSNGPGDPEVLSHAVTQIKLLMEENIPMFGICLGHQLMSLAYGLKIMKMPFGHHGANHPVHDLETNEVFITSQNHNFAVEEPINNDSIKITHKSLFDKTIQGLAHKEKPFYSIQCHPEASPGPKEFEVLFRKFFKEMNA